MIEQSDLLIEISGTRSGKLSLLCRVQISDRASTPSTECAVMELVCELTIAVALSGGEVSRQYVTQLVELQISLVGKIVASNCKPSLLRGCLNRTCFVLSKIDGLRETFMDIMAQPLNISDSVRLCLSHPQVLSLKTNYNGENQISPFDVRFFLNCRSVACTLWRCSQGPRGNQLDRLLHINWSIYTDTQSLTLFRYVTAFSLVVMRHHCVSLCAFMLIFINRSDSHVMC